MSGGVDSSVAAYLLKEQGYEVIGITMRLWQEAVGQDTDGCCGLSAVENAGRVAECLDIPHYVVDFRQEFKCRVVDYFVETYLRGLTPNPCIECNRHMKWGALLRKAMELEADYVATGHYARVDRLPGGRYAVRRSVTDAKDQTYALYSLSQEQLAHTLMPVGEYTKEEVRLMAGRLGLPVADQPDSQEICFVPDGDYAAFIDREAGRSVPGPGNFVAADGKILGRHRGITHYTVGQRRGLELPMGERVYVSRICPETNEVVVGAGQDVFADCAVCENINYMAAEKFESGRRALAKIRYNHKGEHCVIRPEPGGRARAEFERPVRAVTPGQALVFYDGEYVLGGGVIVREE